MNTLKKTVEESSEYSFSICQRLRELMKSFKATKESTSKNKTNRLGDIHKEAKDLKSKSETIAEFMGQSIRALD